MTTWIHTKNPLETRRFNFDFTELPEIVAGQTILSAALTATPDGDLGFGTPIIDGAFVQVAISGGTDDTAYTCYCHIVTSGGSQLYLAGELYVTDGL